MHLIKTFQFVQAKNTSFACGKIEDILTETFEENENKLRKAFEAIRKASTTLFNKPISIEESYERTRAQLTEPALNQEKVTN